MASFTVDAEHVQQTLAALLRVWLPGQSWSQVRKLVDARRVFLNGELWLDSARRLKEGDRVEVLEHSVPKPKSLRDQLVLRHVDEHVVVVEKPAGISTVRHPAEREWSEERRELVPTLDDLVLWQLGMIEEGSPRRPRLRIVHRLDKETSGLVVFAKTVAAERGLGSQFHAHSVLRRYLAVVPGTFRAQTIRSHLVPDRGDGRRGSGPASEPGKRAVTHVEVQELLKGFTLVSCKLETGRTHQIRIHLSEAGHPVCGEMVYNRAFNKPPAEDRSGAPRLALHATELGFQHPVTLEAMHWEMPWPEDLRKWTDSLRG